jgi:[acyl-carrier-protein] S-malonyltransferase
MANMQQHGAEKFVEVGVGTVLQGLAKRTLKDAEITGHQ